MLTQHVDNDKANILFRRHIVFIFGLAWQHANICWLTKLKRNMTEVRLSLYLQYAACKTVSVTQSNAIRFVFNFVCLVSLSLTNKLDIILLIYKQEAQTESGTLIVANKTPKSIQEAVLWTNK